MQIQAGTVAALEFTLHDETGKLVESSKSDDLLYYLHGHDNLPEGFEECLEGRAVGDTFDVTVPPEKAFGQRDDRGVFEIPLAQLSKDIPVQKGTRFHVESQGHTTAVKIIKVKPTAVVVDGNHDLAGLTVRFSGKVVEIRKATKTEMEHGHAHGPGHHHH